MRHARTGDSVVTMGANETDAASGANEATTMRRGRGTHGSFEGRVIKGVDNHGSGTESRDVLLLRR